MGGRRLVAVAALVAASLLVARAEPQLPASATAPAPYAAPGDRPPPDAARRPRVWVALDPLHLTPQSPETIAALDALREALDRSGLQPAESARQATLRVELAGQRMLGGGRGAFPSRFLGGREIALIRATVSRRDELVELRGRSATSNRPWRSAASEVVRAIERWLEDGKTTQTNAAFADASEEATPARALAVSPELLSHIREYVGSYQQAFAMIVAEERYRQEYWQRRVPYPSPAHVTRREQRSEMGFTFFADAGIWFGFRDVLDVDGGPVRNREKELQKLFLDRQPPSAEQFRQVAEASARFNIGPAVRNFNVPMITLLFASPEHRGRCRFELLRMEKLDGVDTAIVAFTETASPTLITRNGHDRPSRGLLWVEPASGRIRRTDLAINEDELEARLTTWFTLDDHIGMMAPTKMREVYDYVERLDEYVETLATYTNFRRFETTTRIVP